MKLSEVLLSAAVLTLIVIVGAALISTDGGMIASRVAMAMNKTAVNARYLFAESR